MKNHVIFKFLAVLLCAACLLGAVGSGAGILALTELDLNGTDAYTYYKEQLQQEAERFAQVQLQQYVEESQEAFPRQIDYSDDGTLHSYQPFPVNTCNYQILDSQGNVLLDNIGATLSDPVCYTFPASGRYRRVYSIQPLEEAQTATIQVDTDTIGEFVQVYGIDLDYGDHASGISGMSALGTASHTRSGALWLLFDSSTTWLEDLWEDSDLLGITLYGKNGDTLYEAHSDTGVGTFQRDQDGQLRVFEGFAPEETRGESGQTGTINSYVNAYESPSLTSSVLSSLGAGYPVEVSRRTVVDGVEWGYISDIGWVLMDQITLGEGDQPEAASARSVAARAFQGLTFARITGYAIPDTTATKVGTCDSGCTIQVYQQAQVGDVDWLYTDMGWVPADKVTVILAEFQEEDTLTQTLQEATLAITDQETPTYEMPGGNVLATCQAGTTLPILRQTDVQGEAWGYLNGGGWVKLEDVALLDTFQPILAESILDTAAPETESAETVPEETVPEDLRTDTYWDSTAQQTMELTYFLAPMPEYTLALYLEKDLRTYFPYYDILDLLCSLRSSLGKILCLSIPLLLALAVYLCCAAARKPGTDDVRPAALNALPLDLYLAGGSLAGVSLGWLMVLTVPRLLSRDWQVASALGLGLAYGICLILVGFCFACAAQFKTPGGYWWRNTLCVRLPLLCIRLFRWLWGQVRRVFPWLGRCLGRVWKIVKQGLSWLWGQMNRFLKLLPLTWQWLLAGAAMFLLLLLAFTSHGLTLLLCLAGCVGIILYGAHCFGLLAQSAKRMSKGDLNIQVEDPWMLGSFQEFAQDLNGLAGVAVVAAQKQLRSERMKTELITNVSHDIKTPLTSIINYVDLLQKPHTQQEEAQYLEVLARQSQRLKKLIEDLMEMSKASTGNMSVDIGPLDAAEAVNQALGEFADKLAAAQLMPVFRQPEGNVTMLADGRLTWRVLSNLLGNAVKYALPGTRLYIDLAVLEGKVVLSLKNISREELNVEAEELLERFVRGDSSRNTEGSGLGLNIAKSLMELQKGSLQLLVDGDLFKVTLIFPQG